MLSCGRSLDIQTVRLKRSHAYEFWFVPYCMAENIRAKLRMTHFSVSVSFLSTIQSLCGNLHGNDDFQHFHKHWIFHSFIFGGNCTQSDTRHTYTPFYRFYRVWQGTWICMTITCESAMSMFSVLNELLFACALHLRQFLLGSRMHCPNGESTQMQKIQTWRGKKWKKIIYFDSNQSSKKF